MKKMNTNLIYIGRYHYQRFTYFPFIYKTISDGNISTEALKTIYHNGYVIGNALNEWNNE